jgi:hypothetical protein
MSVAALEKVAAPPDDEYHVEKLLGKRGKGNAVEYHVKWKGFAAAEATWEPASALSCDEHGPGHLGAVKRPERFPMKM